VRCERASAYLREKGPGFEDVFQLQGGCSTRRQAWSDKASSPQHVGDADRLKSLVEMIPVKHTHVARGPALFTGGIQRYLEAFSDGGFFVGKNFV
jgi:predicted sulfurtransferase